MDSSATALRHLGNKLPAGKCPSSRRTLSFSSLSSLSSSSSASSYIPDDDSPLSPDTPLGFSGVPFSWEKLPGIPKKQNSIKKKDSAGKLLPLPPLQGGTTSQNCKKKITNPGRAVQKDPFLAALLECSKDDHDYDNTSRQLWTGPKVARGVSDRFGIMNLYTSCKRTCAVSESIISVPRSRRTSYDLIGRAFH